MTCKQMNYFDMLWNLLFFRSVFIDIADSMKNGAGQEEDHFSTEKECV